MLFMTFSTLQNPVTGNYIKEITGKAEQVLKEEDPLYMEIIRKRQEYDQPAVDAVIDPVWKAIPGLNGKRIDVQKSYDKMKPAGAFQEGLLTFEEIPPEVTLKDLPPAPVYKGNPGKPMAGMMVNVAWGNEYLPDMLKTFKKYDVKATFFLDGSWVKNNPNLAMMIKEEGHEIGNHAYSHPNMQQLSRERIHDEIRRTNEVINAALNVTPQWFAPPSGSYRDEVVKVAREHGMYTVLWTVDTVDWKKPDPASMADRVVTKTEPGSLILMHPTSSTKEGLETMITGIQKKGLKLGNLSDVLSEKRSSE
ncbi:probable sporulation protein, polysaccharide deacetylase family [Salipaludibacillus aurantiacus]|uniref:Probable sporulation protein, polysaccharide deacetylase family n=1 Tax=Salipaludibacillus aurantiacus TaxID=1601833 RepID=A0A1H9QGD3_9BACI|nr:probable sporulation protein, polysaccharide deacetylase family [Salipaludibacillus aurantiacus]